MIIGGTINRAHASALLYPLSQLYLRGTGNDPPPPPPPPPSLYLVPGERGYLLGGNTLASAEQLLLTLRATAASAQMRRAATRRGGARRRAAFSRHSLSMSRADQGPTRAAHHVFRPYTVPVLVFQFLPRRFLLERSSTFHLSRHFSFTSRFCRRKRRHCPQGAPNIEEWVGGRANTRTRARRVVRVRVR